MELLVNCGFARVAICQYSEVGRGKNFTKLHCLEREQNFKDLFSPLSQYGVQSSIFEHTNNRESTFDRYCKRVNGGFMKWKRKREEKSEYLSTFSIDNWKKLSSVEKQRHSLGRCKECALSYTKQQQSFPGPIYSPAHSLAQSTKSLIAHNSTEKASEQSTTRQILAELQPIYQEAYGHSFTESLAKCKGTFIQKKPTEAERKKLKRKIQRECKAHIEKQLQENDALSVLSEAQSLASYKRSRLVQSFESPQQTQQRAESTKTKNEKHSPNFETISWDKEGVLSKLRNWIPGQPINWTAIGREFNVPGRNKGQVVKEFAMENNINVFELDHRPAGVRMRARKLRMQGGEVSVPTHKTVERIKEDWQKMIESGELTLGEPCYPHTIKKYRVKDGEIQATETVVYGRKIPLLQIRKKLLEKHKSIMHLHTDEELSSLQKTELLDAFSSRNIELPQDLSEHNLRTKLKEFERTRTLGIWHDHSSILGKGYILLTVKIFFDSAVFKQNTDKRDTQAFVEEPEISIIAISSSSIQDQAALIGDRAECNTGAKCPA